VPEDLAREVVFRFPTRMTTPGVETWFNPDYDEGGDVVVELITTTRTRPVVRTEPCVSPISTAASSNSPTSPSGNGIAVRFPRA
jgi:hypothetical protein